MADQFILRLTKDTLFVKNLAGIIILMKNSQLGSLKKFY